MATSARTVQSPEGSAASGRWDATRMREAASSSSDRALALTESTAAGLTEEEAQLRLEKFGPNEIAAHRPESWAMRLFHALRNPLVILLATLAAVSLATGDARAATVMVLMISLGVALRRP
jgi:Mg2+-importing ATPase